MDAHEREAAGAVAAMQREIRIGDRVRGVSGGREFRGGVLVAVDRQQVDVEIDGAWITCSRFEIEHDDQEEHTAER